jgi:hypothetical protein
VVYLWSTSLEALERVVPKDASWIIRSTTHSRQIAADEALSAPHILSCADPTMLRDDDYESAIADAERIFRIIVGPEAPFLAPPPAQSENEDENL